MAEKKKVPLQVKGGKACLKAHGKAYYREISLKYWKSPAGKKRKVAMRKGLV